VAKTQQTMKTYTRKTQDIYFIMGNYGQGWEEADQFATHKEAKEMLKEYNLIQGSHKIVCKRVKIS
jgi:hypothetical protein